MIFAANNSPASPETALLALHIAETQLHSLLMVPSWTPSGQTYGEHAFCLPRAGTGDAEACSPEFWRRQCALRALPRPGAVLAAAREHEHHAAVKKTVERARMYAGLFEKADVPGIQIPDLLSAGLSAEMLRLSAIQRIIEMPVIDESLAFVCGLLAVESIRSRSWREGLVFLYMEREQCAAALVFQGRVLSLLELFVSAEEQAEILLPLLDDFRLGWLFPEKICELPGFVLRIPQLPPEAEGFRPLYVVGDNASAMAGHGRLVEDRLFGGPGCCRGLLYAYAGLDTLPQ